MRESISARAGEVSDVARLDAPDDGAPDFRAHPVSPGTEQPCQTLAASARERSDRADRSGPGLVHLETSDTWNPRSPENQHRRRLSRMRRATITGARLVTEDLQRGGFRYKPAFITLTYARDGEWQPRHISKLLQHYRQWLERRGHKLRACYTAELTGRGRVHYHIVMWLPLGLTPPLPDKQGWWPHGSTQAKWARNPVAYMAKYASKGDVGHVSPEFERYRFPKGCRIHGRSGLERTQRRVVSWWLLPRYVREHFSDVGAWVVRAVGGGWLHRETGEWQAGWRPPLPPPRVAL